MFLRSSNNLDFALYTCGFLIDDQRVWDTDYFTTVSAVSTAYTNFASYNLHTFNLLTGVTGVNFARAQWPLVFEAFSTSLRTVSFIQPTPGQAALNGIEPLPNFYKYPETNVKCNIYEVLDSYYMVDPDPTKLKLFYEFEMGLKTV